MAAIVALAHDLVITIGIYALSGLRGDTGHGHRPADDPRVLALRHRRGLRQGAREHQEPAREPHRPTPRPPTSRSTRPWCARSTPRSWRCIPVGAILYVGAVQLGSGPLKDLALALFVGMAAGAYSSIFIATPLLAQLKSKRDRRPASRSSGSRRARRHDADRYAAVPAFTEDMPIARTPTTAPAARAGRASRRRPPLRRQPAAAVDRGARPRARRTPVARPGEAELVVRTRPADPAAEVQAGQEVTQPGTVDAAALLRSAGRRRPGLPRAGGRVQGHHAAARRPRGASARSSRRWPRPGATRRARSVVDKVVGMEARGFILAAPVALALGRRLRAGPQGRQAAARDVRRDLRAGVRRGDPGDAPRRAAAGRPGAGRRRRARHRRHRRGDRRAGRAVRRRRRTASRC